jgi:hypothetical protein
MRRLAGIAVTGLWIVPAAAQPSTAETVQSLLTNGYAVTASYQSPIGPGLFLQKGDALYLCFVLETPNSTELKTQYCKAVH